MKIVEQSHEILYPITFADWHWEQKLIEKAGRVAYKSEDKITDNSYAQFIKMVIEYGHEAVIEFGNMVVKFVTDRGITHELVRHRLCSFVQESTRYCNYSLGKFDGEVTFIKPSFIPKDDPLKLVSEESIPQQVLLDYVRWLNMVESAEDCYIELIRKGWTPQQARSVLPNCTKAEIIVKANFREWRHIFQLRAISKAAHPDMRALMIPLYEQCRKECPIVFEMGDPE